MFQVDFQELLIPVIPVFFIFNAPFPYVCKFSCDSKATFCRFLLSKRDFYFEGKLASLHQDIFPSRFPVSGPEGKLFINDT